MAVNPEVEVVVNQASSPDVTIVDNNSNNATYLNINGVQYLTGPQGAAGAQGPQGLPGPEGPQGPQGIKGDPGDGAYTDWLAQGNTGTVEDFLATLASTVPGPEGPQGPIGPEGPQGIQGLKGDTGEQGLQGLQGIQGETGPEGPEGPQGPVGEVGPAGTTTWDGIVDKPAIVLSVNDVAPDASGDVAVALGGRVGMGVPPGRYFQITRSNNGTSSFGVVPGTEYGIGIDLGPYSITELGIQVNGISENGSLFRVMLRPIINDAIGAPVVVAEFDTASAGVKFATFPAVALNGPYALSWVSLRSVGSAAATLQRSTFDQNPALWPLQSNTGFTATGHGPVHGILNTGITGATPDSVTIGSLSTNNEGNLVPQIVLRKQP